MPSPPHAAAKPPRVYQRLIVKLTRMTALVGAQRSTLYFTFPGSTKSARSSVTFIKREDVPPFEGDEAWFEIEHMEGKPWSYWRAVRQVERPEGT